ncbi:hypothetical protein [Flexithrix dorotheae]|uniref:hypothetical protein n=1 Tax=Flexithrix dorotheae TaxID=70993 RepID=UPI00146D4137|nr:hypothetical protein [Flexithrix dorotheae]
MVCTCCNAFGRVFEQKEIPGIQERKRAKGIVQILRKTRIDPDKDPDYLEAVLQLHDKLCAQRSIMEKKGVPYDRIQPLNEEIEAYETILFELVPPDFIQQLEAGKY